MITNIPYICLTNYFRWIYQYLPESSTETVQQLLESEKFTVKYEAYDWLINTKWTSNR